ncbi:hypothetical protein KIH39_00760 [Telmatocola sphagniphila]|uniref:Uncharacterized protein n=1 Tax=Telmatocola sphagniphila TaxID=1123043 RepID=A0A8E6B8R6_9BACT|nr:hypothetical protein [Telmatocola sphagniphila]QVL32480.1 hypothetical protein KIH39_00760 [Telmatocola sphagniphila]
MIGKIFVTSSGYDPGKGKDVKDPYLGPKASLGACRPDFREQLQKDDHIFVVSGKVRNVDQFVIGGFAIEEKITAMEAYERFPEHRLVLLPNGQVSGNVIVTADGKQHPLDHHDQFERRIQNYLVGTNTIALLTPEEMEEGRLWTLDILRDVFGIKGNSIRELMGRNRNLSERQVLKLRDHLERVKIAAGKPIEPEEIGRVLRISTRDAIRVKA